MKDLALRTVEVARAIQREAPRHLQPPKDGQRAASELIVPMSIVANTRGYIEAVANQVNGTYERGWFDACAVMVRRLVETLIIEVYESQQLTSRIKNSNQDFVPLSDMISAIMSEATWNLSRDTKRVLPKLKTIGDRAAHSRRFNAHRSDVERHMDDIRIVVQELVYLANLK